MGTTYVVYLWRLGDRGDLVARAGLSYLAALLIGALAGAYGFGTANLLASGLDGVARSNVGALAGAIAAVETFKCAKGIRGSTGVIFVPGFAISVVIGRLGCYLAGIEDFTYGKETSLPWARDFGDGIPRHPVQLYESICMLLFLGWALWSLQRRSKSFDRYGFYWLALFYGGQRFLWEFLKPYATIIGPLNVFHLVCVALAVYSIFMIFGKTSRWNSA